jgi:uncharacterized protein
MEMATGVTSVVMQPNTRCNLDCQYCYLPNRKASLLMPQSVARAVAEALLTEDAPQPVDIVWHGGEPTYAGVAHLESLVSEFDKSGRNRFRHGIQTNATLLDERWVRFFRDHKFLVGVSIDGPEEINRRRVNWGGRASFDAAMRGIGVLQAAELPFTAIAVVGNEGLGHAEEIYSFFAELGCVELGINIEESEGINHAPNMATKVVDQFWDDLWQAWSRDPRLRVREIDQMIAWMAVVSGQEQGANSSRDPFPTIGWDGDVVLLSPELLGASSERYRNFVVGNVLEENLCAITRRGVREVYVQDFVRGMTDCEKSCEYFSYCLGGQASNKFFELGSTRGTETRFCITQAQRLVEAGIKHLEKVELDLATERGVGDDCH